MAAVVGIAVVAGVPSAAAQAMTGEAIEVELVATGVSADDTYEVGDVIEFEYRVTNLTGQARSTELVESNLTGDAACKWNGHPAQTKQTCTFPKIGSAS